MGSRRSLFVEDTEDRYPIGFETVKDDVLALLQAAESGGEVVAGATQERVACNHLSAGLQFVDVRSGLCLDPGVNSVFGDLFQIDLGATRVVKCFHGLGAMGCQVGGLLQLVQCGMFRWGVL